MDSIDQKSLLSKCSEMATIAGLFVGSGSTYYIIKNYGHKSRIGRAFYLAIRSKFQSPEIKSVRKEDIKNIEKNIFDMKRGTYLVIKGPKGVGKTLMLSTCLQKRIGVIYSKPIFPGTPGDEIIKNAHNEITGNNNSTINSMVSANKVIKWYTFLFRSSPIYVINLNERESGKPFAEINAAARNLSDQGLKVIIDCSDNAIISEIKRQIIYEVNPMSDEIIKSIPEFSSLFKFAEKYELIDCILLFCNGNPFDMNEMLQIYNSNIDISEEKVKTEIEKSIKSIVYSARTKYIETIKKYPDLGKRLDEIKNKDNIELDKNEFINLFEVIPDFKNVLREFKKNGETLLIPATPTMAFVLKEDMHIKNVSFNDIKEKVANMKISKKNKMSDHLKIVEQEKNVKV